ncbi:hypothetical protein BJY04DRAFT_73716 [Aspergillus karnatakaensis]|uniref:uncharacterized protein n=1 Tax=Aspergillus karnatakaensis TaxID=1810916 RepID=UPI003CCD995A
MASRANPPGKEFTCDSPLILPAVTALSPDLPALPYFPFQPFPNSNPSNRSKYPKLTQTMLVAPTASPTKSLLIPPPFPSFFFLLHLSSVAVYIPCKFVKTGAPLRRLAEGYSDLLVNGFPSVPGSVEQTLRLPFSHSYYGWARLSFLTPHALWLWRGRNILNSNSIFVELDLRRLTGSQMIVVVCPAVMLWHATWTRLLLSCLVPEAASSITTYLIGST